MFNTQRITRNRTMKRSVNFFNIKDIQSSRNELKNLAAEHADKKNHSQEIIKQIK